MWLTFVKRPYPGNFNIFWRDWNHIVCFFVRFYQIVFWSCAEQTHSSLTSHLLEETYEVLEAIENFNEETGEGSEDLEEELGDLLFQVVFHSRIAADDDLLSEGSF